MTNYKSTARAVLLAVMTLVFAGCTEKETSKPAPSAESSTAALFAEGIPGGVLVDTLTLDAEVVAINHEDRTATLLMPGGEKRTVSVGPEAINFDQIQKGDRVKAVVSEELAVYLGDENAADDDGAATVAVGAAKGEQPGGMVAEMTRITATVTAIDVESHTATLKFEDGRSETVDVRPDVDLSKQQIGAKVVFEITQVVALSVEKQK
jgi:Cu/Ag efflux protein CusF